MKSPWKENDATKSSGQFSSFLVVVAILSVFFDQYNSIVPGITLGELFLVLGCVIIAIKKKMVLVYKNTKIVLYFYFVSLALSFLSLLISNVAFSMNSEIDIITRWIRYFAYICFFVFYCEENNDKISFLRIYRLLCVVISLYTITQFAAFYLFHIYLPVNILPISNSRNITNEMILSLSDKYSFRAYGVFVEPSYLSKFLLPGIVFSVFGWDDKRFNWVVFSIITLAIFVSTSVQGIIIWFITLFMCFLYNYKRFLRKKTSSLILLGILILIIIIYKTGISEYAFERMNNLFEGNDVDRSSQLRLFRGFSFWSRIPLENKIIGVGMGNAANFADSYGIITPYDYYYRNEATLEYMNGLSSIMVYGGLIALAVFCWFIINEFKKTDKIGKIIIIQFILIMFSGSSLLSVFGFFYYYVFSHFRQEYDLTKEIGDERG